jgi:hypothetical protein
MNENTGHGAAKELLKNENRGASGSLADCAYHDMNRVSE